MTAAVETPSGKGAADENFPVGSWLLPARLRPHVAVFYDFARAIDDIADNPALDPADKIARLDGFEAILTGAGPAPAGFDAAGFEKAERMRASLEATDVTDAHCRDLIAAFKQDAVKSRYQGWEDLIGYCNLSAAPVGRYLVDLHGEARALYPATDALCNALQVLNHLQDCADDYRALDRVYLPVPWLETEGIGVDALAAPALSTGLRRVLDRALDGTDALLTLAAAAPRHMRDRRLAMESAVIWRVAVTLSGQLRKRDPLAGRVALSKAQYLACAVRGVAGVMLR